MWNIADYIVIIMAILGFIFPALLISAIRSDDTDKASRNKFLSCLCFGVIILLMGMLLNSN